MDAQIVIRIPTDLKERAEVIAKRSLMSLSDVARQAIKERVENDEARECAKSQTQTTEAKA